MYIYYDQYFALVKVFRFQRKTLLFSYGTFFVIKSPEGRLIAFLRFFVIIIIIIIILIIIILLPTFWSRTFFRDLSMVPDETLP